MGEELLSDQSPVISVIVPIYNVEKYISRCLDSLKAQEFKDFEVIMINDGTKDSSAEIAKEYVDSDPRFHLYNQENQGPGVVRNRGVQLARGEYIAFVDSDDEARPDYLSSMYKAAVESGADIVCCGYYCRNLINNRLRRSVMNKREGVYSRDEIVGCAIRDVTVRSYIWNRLWRKKVFTDSGVAFPPRYFEDGAVVPVLFYYGHTVAVIRNPGYIYTVRSDSITGLTSKRCIGDYLSSVSGVMNFYLTRPEREKYLFSLWLLKWKAGITAFAWIFIRIFRAKTFVYAGTNLKKILRFLMGRHPETGVALVQKKQKKKKKEKAF